jgi:predicted O-linked N-acetylglucosamine transferase (SPINDLY family)
MIAATQPPQFTTPRDRADPDRRLRIGYVSRDFRLHSVAYFIEPVIAHHDRAGYGIYCYYLAADHDDTTQRLSQSADVWREAHGASVDEIAARIYADEIDILVDLGGHTKLNRLGVFSRKPAPVQATWLGYPDTTGLASIDYRITDTVADPPGLTDEIHTERLLRLEPPFVCYQPPHESPAVDLRETAGDVVFGSFNMLIKLNGPLIDMWAQILKAVPDSRLLIKSGLLEHDEAVWRVHERFEKAGIARSRVELRALTQHRMDHLAAYGEVDVALDTFPYNGATTTCEALWMGVPVVTLAGESHMSRVGASLLTAVGLSNLISASTAEYVQTAVALGRDPALRRALRAGMRDRLAASALLDHAGFTRKLEGALRRAWRAWCESSRLVGPASARNVVKARTGP